MNRLQKKCILASVVLHGLLLLVILFGAAFFNKKQAPLMDHRIFVIALPTDGPGGSGGDPKFPQPTERVKGDTTKPQPPTAAPTPPVTKPPEASRVTPPPPPVPQTRAERRPEPRVEPVKPSKPADVAKPNLTTKPTAPTTPKLELVPAVRNNTSKAKEQADALEREKRAADQREAKFRSDLANKIATSSSTGLRAGFESGVKMDKVGGDGSPASANYGLLVREIYDSAWQVMADLANQDFAVTIEVTVSRSGRVVNHRIVNRSGNAGMDRSVQRALDKVKASGLPKFPDGATDSERTFSIEFNLKAKRLLG